MLYDMNKRKKEEVMKKRRIATALLFLLLAGILVGCGKQESKTEKGESTASTETGSSTSSSSDTLTIATNPGVHADVLNKAAEILSGKGLELQIFTYDDYYMPNLLVDDGDADANYFQHETYLEDFNKKLDTHLVSVGKVHFEPLGIYPGTKKSISKLTEGDTMAAYFEAVDMLLSPDDLERLKAHVREKHGYVSFKAMREEIEEMLSKVKEAEGNSSSSPE